MKIVIWECNKKILFSGDSGGGLVFPSLESNNRVVWYLRGIVSTGARKVEGSCDTSKYSTFTNVLFYENFLMDGDELRTPFRCCSPLNQIVDQLTHRSLPIDFQNALDAAISKLLLKNSK